MSKFKVGDKVRCISVVGPSGGVLTLDAIYTVAEVDQTPCHEQMVRVNDHPVLFFASRFELVEEAAKTASRYYGSIDFESHKRAAERWAAGDIERQQQLKSAVVRYRQKTKGKGRTIETKWGSVTVTPVEVAGVRLANFAYEDIGDFDANFEAWVGDCDPFDPNFVARVVAEHQSEHDPDRGGKCIEDNIETMIRRDIARAEEQAEVESKKLPGPGSDAEWGEP